MVAAEDFSFGDTISFDPAKIEVSETSEGLEPIVEEAAMLFANDQIDAATALLNQYLAGHPTESSDEPWLMLFELHQQKGAKNAFDELAMQFVLKFERTAPVWRSGEAEMPAAVQQTQTRRFQQIRHLRRPRQPCPATGATRLSQGKNTGTTARRRTPDSMAARQGRNHAARAGRNSVLAAADRGLSNAGQSGDI